MRYFDYEIIRKLLGKIEDMKDLVEVAEDVAIIQTTIGFLESGMVIDKQGIDELINKMKTKYKKYLIPAQKFFSPFTQCAPVITDPVQKTISHLYYIECCIIAGTAIEKKLISAFEDVVTKVI